MFDIINFEYYKKQILENLNLKGEYKMEKIKHEKYRILKRNIIEDSDFTKETLFILVCAMVIASIGLNTNSVVTNSIIRTWAINWKFEKNLSFSF